ncbi:MAG: hypothetical protein JWN54_3043 [Mycobacterium sp.]|nr:hypothetical protein [Mycobacterium sp.]
MDRAELVVTVPAVAGRRGGAVNVTSGGYGRVATGVAALAVLAVLTSGCTRSGADQAPPVASATASPPASTSPSPSATPAGPYEKDPGVQTMRAYYAALSKAVNARNLRLPELVALTTPKRAAQIVILLRDELGNRVPGPVPFTPVAVRSNGPGSRTVLLCVLSNGFSLDPKTGKPARARLVRAIQADLVKVGGRWKVDEVTRKSFSCAGAEV